MERVPEIGAILQAGTPPASDLSSFVRRVYDQGAEPSCVAFSSCAMKDLEDSIDRGGGPEYAGHVLYRDCGGDGTNGIDSRAALQELQSRGTPLLAGGYGNKIASYSFAPQVGQQFKDTLKAAVAANHPCVIAMLLPSDFGAVCGRGSITTGYHQQTLVGSTADEAAPDGQGYAIILNNWGPSFGNGGFCKVLWSYILQQNMQNGYVFAYLAIDAGNTPAPTPTPQPQPQPQPFPQPQPQPFPQPQPQPFPQPGLILGVSAPAVYHGGLVLASLHMSTGQFVPPGTIVEVKATTPSGLIANGRVTI
jgi:hypothetical protein